MAASATVSQHPQFRNLLVPRHGVVTLFGYGITVNVDRGHLILKDSMGSTRNEGRFARIGHGLRRLVVIGSDGVISLAALRWLADQDAAFVMLERDGSVLAATGPVPPSLYAWCRERIVMQLAIVNQIVGQDAVLENTSHIGGMNPIVEALDPAAPQLF